jgi:hypothetical protein
MIQFNRDGTPPREILERLLQTDPEFAKAAEERGALVRLPDVKPLGNLTRHPEGHDPNELIKFRFLCRGGAALLVGPTGVGKSSLSMQAAICWAAGKPCFGLQPARPLKVLIIQAENDEGDIAEMRDGVLAGLELTPQERAVALANITVVSEDTKTREGFATLLDQLLAHDPRDLVIADPAFAYLGGDASSQRDVSPFLRNMINPVIHKHNIGFLLVHHSNKPPQGEQKGTWQAGDFAYLGAGSAEFANWARAVIALRSIGSDCVFQLLLAKRGRRARWKDAQDRPTTARHIAYHREPGVICWREATPADIEAIVGRGKPSVQDVVDALAGKELWQTALVTKIEIATGLKQRAAYNLVQKAITAGAVEEVRKGPKNAVLLRSTATLSPRPSVADAGDEDHAATP